MMASHRSAEENRLLVCDIERNTVRELPSIDDAPSGMVDPLYYDTTPFHAYHRRFCDRVFRMAAVKGDRLLAWCWIGLCGDVLMTPYSAPFGLIYPRLHWKARGLSAARRQQD